MLVDRRAGRQDRAPEKRRRRREDFQRPAAIPPQTVAVIPNS